MLVIDVLPEEEYTKKHIPSSISIPFDNNANFVQEVEGHLVSKAQRIVVYCAGADCDLSKRAAQMLYDAGLTNVHPFEPGVEGWFANKKAAA